jgi:hypothetical protein
MSPSTTVRPRTDSPARWRVFLDHDVLAILVSAVLALVLTHWLVARPAHVSMTIANDTGYELFVESSAPGSDGWTPVLVLDPGDTRQDRVTVDQGDAWVFRFTGQGHRSDELTVTRDELADAGWTLTIPGEVGSQLERQGAAPPPRSR